MVWQINIEGLLAAVSEVHVLGLMRVQAWAWVVNAWTWTSGLVLVIDRGVVMLTLGEREMRCCMYDRHGEG